MAKIRKNNIHSLSILNSQFSTLNSQLSTFLAFVRKEFYHIFRDTRTILILMGIPIIQIVLFGFAINTEVKDCKIAIYDPSKDISTQRIAERLNTSEYFNIVEEIKSPKDINNIFKEGKISLVIVFSEHFNESLMHNGKAQVQLIADATDPNIATNITNYASAIISNYQQDLMGEMKVPYRIHSEVKLLYNPQMKSSYNFVPGVLGMILMLICAMMTSIAIVREKEMGTMEVLLVSPIKPIYIILAKVVPYFVLSCVNLTSILLLAVFVLNVPVMGSLFWLVIVSLLFIFVSLALGILVSALTDSQLAAMLISAMGFMMPVMLLSGMIYPTENMPIILQYISNIIPAKWYITSVKDLMIKGADVSAVMNEMSILAGMAVILIALSLLKFKNRLE